MSGRSQKALERSWYQANILTVLLWPLTLLHRTVLAVRYRLYKSGLLSRYRSPVPVVIVGNITVGGTGKTPLVVHLVQGLMQAGFKPAVISRGYRAQPGKSPLLVTQDTDPQRCGDEPLLIQRRTGVPVMVGADRSASIQRLIAEFEIDVIVSDDGLQHLSIERDIEICVQDATRQGANTQLLPAGPYREPLTRLKSVDFLVFNGASVVADAHAMTLVPGSPKPLLSNSAAEFDSKAGVHAVAAIGHPERFFQTCESLGWRLERHPFPDHHRFKADEIRFDDNKPVVMTEKDAVKCESFAGQQHWVLPVDAKLSPDLVSRVIERLNSDARP